MVYVYGHYWTKQSNMDSHIRQHGRTGTMVVSADLIGLARWAVVSQVVGLDKAVFVV